MINNIDTDGVSDKISKETGGNAAVKAIFDRIAAHAGTYAVEPGAGGLEFASTAVVKGRPNRCFLKVWQPSSSQLLVWFYKRSAIQHSRDRYSYGGIEWDPAAIDLSKIGDEVDAWLIWLDSGFNAEKRPMNWISAFTYDIPE
jgi:hypothetical protein